MTDYLGDVLPVLKAPDWEGHTACTSRRVLSTSTMEGRPWLAFQYDLGMMAAFVGPDRLEKLGKTAREVEEEALRNLASRPFEWSVDAVERADGTTFQYAMVTGELAAERLLDPAALRQLHKALGAEILGVVAPYRGLLLAAPIAQAADGTLNRVAASWFRASGDREPISSVVFLASDGVLMGTTFVS